MTSCESERILGGKKNLPDGAFSQSHGWLVHLKIFLKPWLRVKSQTAQCLGGSFFIKMILSP